jgi:hypothetical protein
LTCGILAHLIYHRKNCWPPIFLLSYTSGNRIQWLLTISVSHPSLSSFELYFPISRYNLHIITDIETYNIYVQWYDIIKMLSQIIIATRSNFIQFLITAVGWRAVENENWCNREDEKTNLDYNSMYELETSEWLDLIINEFPDYSLHNDFYRWFQNFQILEMPVNSFDLFNYIATKYVII